MKKIKNKYLRFFIAITFPIWMIPGAIFLIIKDVFEEMTPDTD